LEDGTVDVLTSANDGSDVITIHVENVSGVGNRAPIASIESITDFSVECDSFNPGGNCWGNSVASFDVEWSVSDPDGNLNGVSVELIDPDGTVVDTATFSYPGVGSTSDTTTLEDDPGQWNEEYTIRVTASDGDLSDVTTQVDTADGG
jgi:hypothetical protein